MKHEVAARIAVPRYIKNIKIIINNYVVKGIREYIRLLTGANKVRTGNVTFNIIMSFLLRAVSIVVSFLVISFSLKLLDTSKYGIWLAISSIVGWVSILDIGLAYGLRNKIAEYLAKKEYDQAKIAVSLTYAIVLNWAGKVKTQSIVSVITAVLLVPIVLFFIRLHLGLNSLVYASIIWIVLQVIIWKNEITSVLKLKQNLPDADLVYNGQMAIVNS